MVDLFSESEIPIVLGEFQRVLRSDGRLVLLAMAEQKAVFQKLWMSLYRLAPVLVGNCRPIDTAQWLRKSGWEVEREERITQLGFRSALLVARPRTSGLDG